MGKAPSVGDVIHELARHGHSGFALLAAATIESRLVYLLSLKMPKLSKRLEGKLFKSMGGLSGFSVKIDLAFAMGLIAPALRRDLHLIRDIRNEFAHSPKHFHCNSEEIVVLLKKFDGLKAGTDHYGFLGDRVTDCLKRLDNEISHAELLNLVSASTPAPKLPPSPEK